RAALGNGRRVQPLRRADRGEGAREDGPRELTLLSHRFPSPHRFPQVPLADVGHRRNLFTLSPCSGQTRLDTCLSAGWSTSMGTAMHSTLRRTVEPRFDDDPHDAPIAPDIIPTAWVDRGPPRP